MKSLYQKSILTSKVVVPFYLLGSNLDVILLQKLRQTIEGKCIKEGYVKPNSITLIQYSSGKCHKQNVHFIVSFSCMICCPLEGINIKVVVSNITKAGIRAKSRDESSPIDVFVCRDHNINNQAFLDIHVGDEIFVEIIGHRYELNDKTISVIADISDKQSNLKVYKSNSK